MSGSVDITRKRIVGASILPICRDRVFQNIYFYLGRERRSSRWIDSDCWSDFGGSVKWKHGSDKDKDKSEEPEECASREAWEETCSMMKFGPNDEVPLSSYTNIKQKLKNDDYLMKIKISQPDGSQYVTWIVEVPFDAELPKKFAECQQKIRSINYIEKINDIRDEQLRKHPALRNRMRVDPCFMEKANIQLFSIPNLVSAIENKGALIWRYGYSEYLRDSFYNRLAIILKTFNIRCNVAGLSAFKLTKVHLYPIKPELENVSPDPDEETAQQNLLCDPPQ